MGGVSSSVGDFALKDVTEVLGAVGTLGGAVVPLITKQDAPHFDQPKLTTLEEMEQQESAKAEKRRREILRRRGVKSTIKTSGTGAVADIKAPQFGVK